MPRMVTIRFCFLLIVFALSPTATSAEITRIATASNFKPTLIRLLDSYASDSSSHFKISSGSSGVLYAQIRNGAPFDIFMSADMQRPALLEEEGLIVPGSRMSYAVGRLALWVPSATTQINAEFLTDFQGILAIANPDLAPYGVAAMSMLKTLNTNNGFKIVRGNNIAQSHQFVLTGNAQAGIVALSQMKHLKVASQQYWPVAEQLHGPIEQQLVVLKPTSQGLAFISFLNTSSAHSVLRSDGYSIAERLDKPHND